MRKKILIPVLVGITLLSGCAKKPVVVEPESTSIEEAIQEGSDLQDKLEEEASVPEEEPEDDDAQPEEAVSDDSIYSNEFFDIQMPESWLGKYTASDRVDGAQDGSGIGITTFYHLASREAGAGGEICSVEISTFFPEHLDEIDGEYIGTLTDGNGEAYLYLTYPTQIQSNSDTDAEYQDLSSHINELIDGIEMKNGVILSRMDKEELFSGAEYNTSGLCLYNDGATAVFQGVDGIYMEMDPAGNECAVGGKYAVTYTMSGDAKKMVSLEEMDAEYDPALVSAVGEILYAINHGDIESVVSQMVFPVMIDGKEYGSAEEVLALSPDQIISEDAKRMITAVMADQIHTETEDFYISLLGSMPGIHIKKINDSWGIVEIGNVF